MLCIIPTITVLSFFFQFFLLSRVLQTGIQQTGPNQFVENQKQNQDNMRRIGMKSLPERLKVFLLKRLCRNVLFPYQVPLGYFPLSSSALRPLGRLYSHLAMQGRTGAKT